MEPKNTCRACLTEEGSFKSVFLLDNNPGLSLHLSEMLSSFANIQVIKEDGLPDQICSECSEITVKTYLFKLKCEKSDETLRERQRNKEILGCDRVEVEIKPESDNNDRIEFSNSKINSNEASKMMINEEIEINYEGLALNDLENVEKREFECDICLKKFSREDSLTSHKIGHSMKTDELEIKNEELQAINIFIDLVKIENEKDLFCCLDCDFYFTKEKDLDDHFNRLHNDERNQELEELRSILERKPHGCDICFEGFQQLSELQDHMRTHSNKKSVLCSNENEYLNRIDILPENTIIINEKKFNCNICNESFPKKYELSAHLQKHIGKELFVRLTKDQISKHSNSPEKDKLHSTRHQKGIHTGEKLHKCDICKKKCSGSENLKMHKRIHTGEKPFKCKICKKKFSRQETLTNHKRTHTGKKPYKCEMCDNKFSRSWYLADHKRIHTGEKPYKCGKCDRTFASSVNLKRHRLNHLSVKPHECDVCKKRFSARFVLKKHKKIHTSEKLYGCDVCKKRFSVPDNLRKHKITHSDEKPFECDVCGKKFLTFAYLRGHKVIHTGVKPYGCDECEKRFFTSLKLKKHKGTHSSLLKNKK